MENSEEIKNENVETNTENVSMNEEINPMDNAASPAEEAAPAENVVSPIEEATPEENVVASEVVAPSQPIKRRKKDIIGYNPQTGEPIYRELAPGENPNKGGKKGLIIAIIAIILVVGVVLSIIFLMPKGEDEKEVDKKDTPTEKKDTKKEEKKDDKKDVLGDYVLSTELSDYDLSFLKFEKTSKNLVYSPLSIKYTLGMLKEGTAGDSYTQINSVVGDYKAKKYTNSSNMSFANALFVNNAIKDDLEKDYASALVNKYNAEVVYDEFKDTTKINSWVKEKTLNLIPNALDSIDDDVYFYLINALGIDMEWKNLIQPKEEPWSVTYAHEKYNVWVSDLQTSGYTRLKFNNSKDDSKAVSVGASVNNYDIVKDLGEDKIRETVTTEYEKWLASDEVKNNTYCHPETDVKKYVDGYIKDINSNYGQADSSTDFMFYIDDDIKAFAKDLKEYNGVTLQYIAVMPQKESLTNYVNKVKATDINKIINNLKEVKNENFKKDVITKITGIIPLFNFDYELDLINDLKNMGITDIFDSEKADLSKLAKGEGIYISDAIHKANIEFSNEGIKASAVTMMGGRGASGCDFIYDYEVPVEEIDLTFDKPYMFIIRDKNSGEVWFVGTVYEPSEYTNE